MDKDVRKLKKVMEAIRSRYAKSGMTQQEFGEKMGFPEQSARKSAWQFLDSTGDPRLSTLLRCARAFGVNLRELLEEL